MLLSGIDWDSIRIITIGELARTADNDWLWLIHENALSGEIFSNTFGAMMYVRHRYNDGFATTATGQNEGYQQPGDFADQMIMIAE
jgi:hypothetical protein